MEEEEEEASTRTKFSLLLGVSPSGIVTSKVVEMYLEQIITTINIDYK